MPTTWTEDNVDRPASVYSGDTYNDRALAQTPSSVALTILGASGQTANLSEWQNSAGTVLSSIGPTGNVFVPNGFVSAVRGIRSGPTSAPAGMKMFVSSGTATDVMLGLRGAASQSGDLLQFQTSSASLLSRITASGVFSSPSNSSFINPNGGQVFLTAALDTITPIVARGAASQSADLQQWQDNAGNYLAGIAANGTYISAAGIVQLRSGVGAASSALFVTPTASSPGVLVQGRASQTADLQQWQDSAGTVLARVDSVGATLAPYFVAGRNIGNPAANLQGNPDVATRVGLLVRGAASQSANLAEFQNSAGTVLAAIRSGGDLGVLPDGTARQTNAALEVHPPAANLEGLVVRGVASQTANLAEFRNSAGTVLASVASDGNVQVGDGGGPGGNLGVTARGAAQRPLVVRGAASQSANLIEVQNSAGTLLTHVHPSPVADGCHLAANFAGLGPREFRYGAVDSAGAGFRTVRIAN